jgi:CRISPR/Cas system-associated exonuclease Cas4 (RecB family)
MSQYYNPRRTKNLFQPNSSEPFRLSRSKIDLFVQCPRCFYFDLRLGVGRPSSFPMTLNNAVDMLMKKEFDLHRAEGSAHPLMKKYGIDAVPLADERLEEWRDALRRGISFHHKKTNLILRGGVDDVWVKPNGELIVVDYKATSKDEEITLDDEWKIQYKRQMEIYQWLFKQNGFEVCDTGYFVYVNGKTDRKAFDGKLEFDVTIIPHKGTTDWIEGVITSLHACLADDRIPAQNPGCDHCNYIGAIFATHKERKGAVVESDTIKKIATPADIAVKTSKKKSSLF